MPYAELLQERYADDPWKLLVCCVLLNQTTRSQVDKVIERGLFEKYPGAVSVSTADEVELYEAIRSTGFGMVKARRLIALSNEWFVFVMDYERHPTAEEIECFTGVGQYAADSYRIFHLRDTSRCDSRDKELVAWAERNGITWKE